MSGPANGGNGEWICRRCSFSNPATAPVCVSCALLRGADVPAAEAFQIAAGNVLAFFGLGDTPVGRRVLAARP